MEKYGIENLQRIGAGLVRLGTDLKSALADGKINLQEGIQLGSTFITYSDLFSKGADIVNEVKDLSDTESDTLIQGIASSLGTTVTPKLRNQIVRGWDLLHAGHMFYKSFVDEPAEA